MTVNAMDTPSSAAHTREHLTPVADRMEHGSPQSLRFLVDRLAHALGPAFPKAETDPQCGTRTKAPVLFIGMRQSEPRS